MKIISTEKRTVANGEVWVIDLVKNEPGNTVVGETYITTSTNVPYTVTASVDGTNYLTQKVIAMGSYETKDNVTTAGYYLVPCAGLAKLKLTFTGSGDVTVKEVF